MSVFKIIKCVVAALFVLQVSACTFTYSSKGLNDSATKLVREFHGAIKRLKDDYNQLESIYRYLLENSSTPKATPYPAMGNQLAVLKSAVEDIERNKEEVTTLNISIKRLTLGKRHVPINSPELTKVEQRLQNFKSTMEVQIGRYQQERETMTQIMKNGGVGRMDIPKAIAEYKSYLAKTHKHINKIKRYLRRNHSAAQRAEKSGLVQQLERENSKQVSYLHTLESYAPAKESWMGPGTDLAVLKYNMTVSNQNMKKLAVQLKALM